MPRKALVSVIDAVATIEKFIKHFQEGNYPKYSSDIWTQMSTSLNEKWSSDNIYNNVVQNRRNIMRIACENQNIPFIPFVSKSQHMKDLLSDSNSSDDDDQFNKNIDDDFEFENEARGLDEFEVIILKDEWKSIQSLDVVYNDNRHYSILQCGCWTDVLAIAIFRSTKIPCAYSFKYARIYKAIESKHYLRIRGYCKSKSCGNVLFGYLYKKPAEDTNVTLIIRTKETWWNDHEPIKRHLKGKKRQQVGEKAFHKGTANFCKRQIREETDFDGRIPPHVPNSTAVSRAKNEYIDRFLGVNHSDGKDIIKTIENMNHAGPYMGCIHEVKRKKFYVSFSSPMQIHTYKKYCRTARKALSVSIDGTGSIVKSITHEDNSLSGHIFLYSITINFNNSTLSVYDMFTESQDTDIIVYWLRQWLKLGAPKPKEAVCDSSRALMNGISQGFNYQTVKTYIETCFLYASGHEEYHYRPPIFTYLRLDVAHFMIMIRRWACFTHLRHTKIRHFYLYCIGLLIDCQTIEQFENIFRLLCIVSLNENEDAIVKKVNSSVLDAKNKLDSYIATRNFDYDFENFENYDEEMIENDNKSPTIKEECDKDETNYQGNEKMNQGTNHSRIQIYIDNLYEEATLLHSEGSRPNICFFKDFMYEFKAKAYEFPLWTAVAIPHLVGHASTSYVEGHFNIVKHNIMKNHKLPLRVDKALKLILNDYIGNASEVQAKLTNFYQAYGPYPSPQSKKSVFLNRITTNTKPEPEKKMFSSDQYDSNPSDVNPSDCYTDVAADDFTRFKPNNFVKEHNFVSKLNPLPKASTKKNGFYFKPNSKLQQLNMSPVIIEDLPLLSNGNRITNPAIISGLEYFASNTCGFDSIVQILSASALDDPAYMTYIQTSENRVLQFVTFFIVNKASAATYKQRIILLKEVYTDYIVKQKNLKSCRIDLFTCLTTIYKIGFGLLPSGSYSHSCPTCGIYTSPVIFLQLTNEKIIVENGFGALEEALKYEWQETLCIKRCNNYCRRKLNLFFAQVFIELDVRKNLESITAVKGKLSDFPVKLNLGNNQYRLAGIVERVPGHYVSYCRRINNRWDFCNDLSNKINSVHRDTQVEPHGIIYIKESSSNNEHIEDLIEVEQSKESESPLIDKCISPINCENMKSLSTTPLDDSDTISRDNWRNKETQNKFYFNTSLSFDESCLEATPITEKIQSTAVQKNPVSMLQIGDILPSILINNNIFELSDTSNFDCIVHIISCSAIDSNNYMDSLKKSINETIKFTLDFIESKFSAHIYEQRALLLKSLNFYTLSIEKKTGICTYKINVCEDAAGTWKICLNNEPSVFNTYICNSCEQCTFITPVLKVDPKIIINHGFKALNRAVIFCKTLKKVKCRKENCFKLCTVTAYPNFHIFIALDVIDKNNKCIEYCLEDLPITLNLDMVDKYRLAGIIGSYHNYQVAYCLRSDNNWELYDGYSCSIEIVDELTTIQPLGAIYILE